MQPITLPGAHRRTTSQLGFGCSGLMSAMDRRHSLAVLETAFDAGVRHFDTAPLYGYGEAEACLGEFAARHPGQITITTKYGLAAPRRADLLRPLRQLAQPVLRRLPQMRARLRQAATPATTPSRTPFRVADVQASLERSLRALRTSYIDLYLLHEVRATDLLDPELQSFLTAAQTSGKIGAYGCASTRSSVVSLQAALPWLCDVLQYDWAPDSLLPGQPAFRMQHRVLASHLRKLPATFLTENKLQNCSPAQVLFRAALSSEPSGIVLFSSTDPRHVRSCAQAATSVDLAAPAAQLLTSLQAAAPAVPHAPALKYSRQPAPGRLP